MAWNEALSPSEPICSDGITVDTNLPEFGGVIIPGGVSEGGLARDISGRVWLIGRDRQRVLVRGGEHVSACTSSSRAPTDLSEYPIQEGDE